MKRVNPFFALALAAIGITGAVACNAPGQAELSSNGKQIFTAATSQRGTPITSDIRTGMMMGNATVACASCHGPDGRGAHVQMMTGSVDAPDIRYATLTSGHMQDHPAYTDETIKRAITLGIDPGGKALQAPMPHWTMSADDLNDVVGYLKTLN